MAWRDDSSDHYSAIEEGGPEKEYRRPVTERRFSFKTDILGYLTNKVPSVGRHGQGSLTRQTPGEDSRARRAMTENGFYVIYAEWPN